MNDIEDIFGLLYKETESGDDRLYFELVKDSLGFRTHNFRLKLKCKPKIGLIIVISGVVDTYFPNAWKNWVSNFNSRTIDVNCELKCDLLIFVWNNIEDTSCIESYSYFDQFMIEAQMNRIVTISKTKNITETVYAIGENPDMLLICRQHPGESVASRFLDGVIDQIQLHKHVKPFIVDICAGHQGVADLEYRCVRGIDLNRNWHLDLNNDNLRYIRSKIINHEIRQVIDVHGDESTLFDYYRMTGKSDIILPDSVVKLHNQSILRIYFSRLFRKIKTKVTRGSLKNLCKIHNISYTLIELSMIIDRSYKVGSEFAKLNLVEY